MISYNLHTVQCCSLRPYSTFGIHLALNMAAKSPKLTNYYFFPFIWAEIIGSNCCGNQSFFQH